MKTKLIHISIKMIIVGTIALFIAKFLGVTNYTTASAIGILSVQWTKRDFITIATKRLISGILSILFSAALFYFFPQSFVAYILFMGLFILLSWLFNAPEGIVPSMVIVAHIFLINTLTTRFIFEEILLLIIAVVVAFIVNMLYPQFNMSMMEINLQKVDALMEDELSLIINGLTKKEENIKINSKDEISHIMSEAKMIDRDLILQNDHRYITYLYMRNTQLNVLADISKNINRIKGDHPYKLLIVDFLIKLKNNISYYDKASPLLVELTELNNYFIKEELPKTREEFEIRANLFIILNEIRTFLDLKIEFHNKYPNFMEKGDLNE